MKYLHELIFIIFVDFLSNLTQIKSCKNKLLQKEKKREFQKLTQCKCY